MSSIRWKKIFSLALITLLFGSIVTHFVRAEDDEEDDHYEEEDDAPAATSTSSGSTSSKPKTITTTQYIPPRYTTVNVTVTLKDVDRDGLPDTRDPYPEIPQQIIVADSNENGITDIFEGIESNSGGTNENAAKIQTAPRPKPAPAPTTTTKRS